MRTVFADTFYFLALLDSRERRHPQAVEVSCNSEFRPVTTEWVLAEFGDAYSHPKDRPDFVALYRSTLNHPRFKIIPADTRLFQRAVDFFEQRLDKNGAQYETLGAYISQCSISLSRSFRRHLTALAVRGYHSWHDAGAA